MNSQIWAMRGHSPSGSIYCFCFTGISEKCGLPPNLIKKGPTFICRG
jgi:hypothetical protein